MRLVLPTELTLAQASACLTGLLVSMRAAVGPELVIDGAALVEFDSSALAVLLACRRESQVLGKRLSLIGLPARLADLARLYGILELLTPPAPSS